MAKITNYPVDKYTYKYALRCIYTYVFLILNKCVQICWRTTLRLSLILGFIEFGYCDITNQFCFYQLLLQSYLCHISSFILVFSSFQMNYIVIIFFFLSDNAHILYCCCIWEFCAGDDRLWGQFVPNYESSSPPPTLFIIISSKWCIVMQSTHFLTQFAKLSF